MFIKAKHLRRKYQMKGKEESSIMLGLVLTAAACYGIKTIYNYMKPNTQEKLRQMQKSDEQFQNLETQLEEEETEIALLTQELLEEQKRFEVLKRNLAKTLSAEKNDNCTPKQGLESSSQKSSASHPGSFHQFPFFVSDKTTFYSAKNQRKKTILKRNELDEKESQIEEDLVTLEESLRQLLDDQEVLNKQILTAQENLTCKR